MFFNVKSGDSMTAVLAAAKNTNDPAVLVNYTDTKPESGIVSLNGVTAVTLASGACTVNGISLVNTDLAAITLTISQVIGGTSYTVWKGTLGIGDVLVIDASGVVQTDTNGQRKTANAATVPVTLTGAVNQAVGASTAAAGSTYADAGALPAGTGGFYPTTGADDTKGVIISTSDQVTGRTLDIGNGVSNKILKVYGPAGAVINGAAANAAFSSVSGHGVRITCLSGSGNTWSAS